MSRIHSNNQDGRFGKRLAISLIASLALTVAMASLGASPASAHTYTKSGTIGGLTVIKTTGYGTPNDHVSPNRVDFGRVNAWRSSAFSGTQRITVSGRVWKFENQQWVVASSMSQTYTVYAGQYVNHLGWTFSDQLGLDYSTDVTVTWRTSTGAFIGQYFADFVHSGDYACGTSWPSCRITTVGGQAALTLS